MQILRDQWLHCLAGGGVGCFVHWSPVPRVPDVPGVPLGIRVQQEWGSYWCDSDRAGAGDQVPLHQPSQAGGHWAQPWCCTLCCRWPWLSSAQGRMGCEELESSPAATGNDIPGSWHGLLEPGLAGGAWLQPVMFCYIPWSCWTKILENSVFVFFAISDCVTNVEQALCLTTVLPWNTVLECLARVVLQEGSTKDLKSGSVQAKYLVRLVFYLWQ